MPPRYSRAATSCTWWPTTRGTRSSAQIPEAQSALVALDPNDGSIVALVGGFDYFTNKYNRVTQARRLPGSGFKPFLYSAALENGFTPATVLLDAPIVLEGNGNEDSWRPENSTKRVRRPDAAARGAGALAQPGVDPHPQGDRHPAPRSTTSRRFGFDARALPHDLTLALGTLEATPLDVAAGYAVFANGGYRVQPYFIERIEDAAGQVVWRAAPRTRVPAVRSTGQPRACRRASGRRRSVPHRAMPARTGSPRRCRRARSRRASSARRTPTSWTT